MLNQPIPTFSGVMTALATPFAKGVIDEAAYERLIEMQIAAGISGLVPCGTTGESVTLTDDECLMVIALALRFSRGRVPVIAGTGASSTAVAVERTREACKLGVQGCLVVTPAYNKPPQSGLIEHYKAVARASSVPVVLYNVPGRTSCNMLAPTVKAIADACPNVTSIKEASADLAQIANVKRLAPRLDLISGDDGTVVPTLAVGGVGVISVASNIAPGHMVRMVESFRRGDVATAERIQLELMPLIAALFMEANPIPVKFGLARLGIGDGGLRLPLVAASEATRERMLAEMQALKLL